ncbi:MAG: hypothetical protein JWP57_2035 [Spirosoma sp.]|nr:hypothetical protein [Spirosoma sp.]
MFAAIMADKSAQIRLQTVLSALGTTANAFGLQHGLNIQTLYNIAKGRRKPGFDILQAICKAEPRISAEYLLRGEGSPLRHPEIINPTFTADQLRSLQADIDALIAQRLAALLA